MKTMVSLLFLWQRARVRQNNFFLSLTHSGKQKKKKKKDQSRMSKLATNPLWTKSGTKVKFKNILLSIYAHVTLFEDEYLQRF